MDRSLESEMEKIVKAEKQSKADPKSAWGVICKLKLSIPKYVRG